MSYSKRWASAGVLMALWTGLVAAEELPRSSILQRYGVSVEQLPAGQPAPAQSQPAPASRFNLQPDSPTINLRLGDGTAPPSTGNISIDNAEARERERCQQMRDQLSKRGKPLGISCAPGQGPLPWSP